MKFLQFPVAFRTLPHSPVLSRATFPRCERSAPLPIPAQFQCVSVVPLVPGLVTYTPLLYILYLQLGQRIDFCLRISDLRELSVAHLLRSPACRTRARP